MHINLFYHKKILSETKLVNFCVNGTQYNNKKNDNVTLHWCVDIHIKAVFALVL